MFNKIIYKVNNFCFVKIFYYFQVIKKKGKIILKIGKDDRW